MVGVCNLDYMGDGRQGLKKSICRSRSSYGGNCVRWAFNGDEGNIYHQFGRHGESRVGGREGSGKVRLRPNTS